MRSAAFDAKPILQPSWRPGGANPAAQKGRVSYTLSGALYNLETGFVERVCASAPRARTPPWC
eukprot:1872960-Prymnesium_polylepis.1